VSESLGRRIAAIVVARLELTVAPEAIALDAPLFAPRAAGGLELDSVAALEIIAALADEFDRPFDDIDGPDLMSVGTLAAYLQRHGVA
jgi:acyl carrier protein